MKSSNGRALTSPSNTRIACIRTGYDGLRSSSMADPLAFHDLFHTVVPHTEVSTQRAIATFHDIPASFLHFTPSEELLPTSLFRLRSLLFEIKVARTRDQRSMKRNANRSGFWTLASKEGDRKEPKRIRISRLSGVPCARRSKGSAVVRVCERDQGPCVR